MSDKLLLPLPDDYAPEWVKINAWFRASCLDRTGTIKHGDFDYHILTPIRTTPIRTRRLPLSPTPVRRRSWRTAPARAVDVVRRH